MFKEKMDMTMEELWKAEEDSETVDDKLFDGTVKKMAEELRFEYERKKNSR